MTITTAQAERIIKLATEIGDAREARGSLSVWRKLLDHPEDAQYHAQSKLSWELALELQRFVEDLTKPSPPVVGLTLPYTDVVLP